MDSDLTKGIRLTVSVTEMERQNKTKQEKGHYRWMI